MNENENITTTPETETEPQTAPEQTVPTSPTPDEVNAANAALVAESSGVADVSSRLVFLTEVHDTRFDDYSVLRPLEAAH